MISRASCVMGWRRLQLWCFWLLLAACVTPPQAQAAIEAVKERRQPEDTDDASAIVATTSLPLGDINIVVLTDTHSWVGGHREKEDFDADYGDVLSFYRLLQNQIAALQAIDPELHKHDLYFVMNGDWIDGTGLAMNGDPSYLIPILEKMPWDAVNIGNHELYKSEVISYMNRAGGFVEWWGSRFLTSNVVMTDTMEPMGNEYHFLRGEHTTVLVFGFLFNMLSNDPMVTVKKVEDTVAEQWFEVALMGGSYDAIVVLAHMDHEDDLVHVILERIRHFVDQDMPVQFITGHTHQRANSTPDEYSASFEAGNYLNTVGFVSIPTQSTIQKAAVARTEAANAAAAAAAATPAPQAGSNNNQTNSTNSTTPAVDSNSTDTSATNADTDNVDYKDQFQHVFIDAKYSSLADALGLEFVTTREGIELSNFIFDVQSDLGLYKIVGCIENNHYMENAMYEQYSLWGMWCNHVVPHVFPHGPEARHNPRVVVMTKGAFRYDLYARELILDEVIAVSPFNETIYSFEGVPGRVLSDLNFTLNDDGTGVRFEKVPKWVMCKSPAESLPQPGEPAGADQLYDLLVTDFVLGKIQETLEDIYENGTVSEPKLLPQHTTTSVWLEFFDKTDLCQTENKGKHKTPKSKDPASKTPPGDSNSNNANNSTGGLGDLFNFGGEETEYDEFRVDFVWIAVAVVAVFTAVYVRQRSRIWRSQQMIRDGIIREAEDEYNGMNGIGYRDEPDGQLSFDSLDEQLESHFENNLGVQLDSHFEIGGESDEFVNSGAGGDLSGEGPELDLL